MNFPLLSVIVPVYNVQATLSKCVESILGQTYTNLQIILVDDGSSDSSPKICDDFALRDKRIFTVHKENGGLVSARKAGLEVASGAYIAFVDSDDWIESEMYECMLQKAVLSDADIVESGYFSDNEKQTSSVPYPIQYDGIIKLDYTIKRDNIIEWLLGHFENKVKALIWTKVYKSEFIKKSYSKIPCDMQHGEDLANFVNIIPLVNSIACVSKVFYHYVSKSDSMSNAISENNLKKYFYCFGYCRSKIKEYFSDIDKERLDYWYLAMLNDATTKYQNYIKMNGFFSNSIQKSVPAAVSGKKESVSIIVPLFKGQKYIGRLFEMVEANYLYENLCNFVDFELIFVNDYPNEKIMLPKNCGNYSVRLITNDSNVGIHASRINGVKHSSGTYILFLDQDDFIAPDYVSCQLSILRLSDEDMVICDGWFGHFKRLETECSFFEVVNNLNHYLAVANAIMSPGQVLLKKSVLPKNWLDIPLKKNGADDLFLWILLLKEGRKFVINRTPLYYHTPDRTEDSVSTEKMSASVLETYEVLKSLNLLDQNELALMEKQVSNLQSAKQGKITSAAIFVSLAVRETARTYINELFFLKKSVSDIFVVSHDPLILKWAASYDFKIIKNCFDMCSTAILFENCKNFIKAYDYICFIDDKQENFAAWNCFFGTEFAVKDILWHFEHEPHLGVLTPSPNSTGEAILYRNCFFGMEERKINIIKERLDLNVCYDFFHKTCCNMEAFWARSSVMTVFLNIDWMNDEFFSEYNRNSVFLHQFIYNRCERLGLDFHHIEKDCLPCYSQVVPFARKEIETLASRLADTEKSLAAMEKSLADSYENIIKINLDNAKSLYIYGAGKLAAKAENILREKDIAFEGFVVTDKNGQNEYLGHKVFSYFELKNRKELFQILVAMNEKNARQVIPVLQKDNICYFYISL